MRTEQLHELVVFIPASFVALDLANLYMYCRAPVAAAVPRTTRSAKKVDTSATDPLLATTIVDTQHVSMPSVSVHAAAAQVLLPASALAVYGLGHANEEHRALASQHVAASVCSSHAAAAQGVQGVHSPALATRASGHVNVGHKAFSDLASIAQHASVRRKHLLILDGRVMGKRVRQGVRVESGMI